MDKILLDTDIFSEILKQKHEKVATRAEQYHSYFGFYTITTITVLEIIKGFHKVGRENHILAVLSYSSNYHPHRISKPLIQKDPGHGQAWSPEQPDERFLRHLVLIPHV